MKHLDLTEAKNHIELYVIQESNSFGDQILTFRHESLDGSITESFLTNCEGSWDEFAIKPMLEAYQRSLTSAQANQIRKARK